MRSSNPATRPRRPKISGSQESCCDSQLPLISSTRFWHLPGARALSPLQAGQRDARATIGGARRARFGADRIFQHAELSRRPLAHERRRLSFGIRAAGARCPRLPFHAPARPGPHGRLRILGALAVPVRLLAVRSGFIPPVFGYLLFVAGFGYLASATSILVLPQTFRRSCRNSRYCSIRGELPIIFWLLIRGARGPGRDVRRSRRSLTGIAHAGDTRLPYLCRRTGTPVRLCRALRRQGIAAAPQERQIFRLRDADDGTRRIRRRGGTQRRASDQHPGRAADVPTSSSRR